MSRAGGTRVATRTRRSEAVVIPPPLPLPRYPVTSPARANSVLASFVLLVVIGAVLAGIGLIAVGIVVVVIGIALAVLSKTLGSPARLARAIGGRTASPAGDARLVNVVEGLCVGNGIGVPQLRVLDDPAANAIVIGSNEQDAVLICTTGLLGVLDRMELEAVVAHELAHLKRGDLRTTSRATRALGLYALVSAGATRTLASLAGPAREACADLDAVAMTRYPPALASALAKLERTPSVPAGLATQTERLTAPFWCVPLGSAQPTTSVQGTLALSERVAMLAEL
jgi:Zn-dependent protease with chaperone function